MLDAGPVATNIGTETLRIMIIDVPGGAVDPPFSPLIPTAPFDDNVFRGNVRKWNAVIVNGNGVGTAVNAVQQGSSSGGRKKRLSRFAQQRLKRE